MGTDMQVDGIVVSSNTKTGRSLNVDSCQPTPRCRQDCYRHFRTNDLILRRGWSSTSNSGPITWAKQVACYQRNERLIKVFHQADVTAGLEPLRDLAERMARKVLRRQDFLRGNGTGDLFPELCQLYCQLVKAGLRVYLYSRIAEQILLLDQLCREQQVQQDMRPYVLGSVDPSTTNAQARALIAATKRMNGKATLALAVRNVQEVKDIPTWQQRHIKVVFGYHTNRKQTTLGDPRECPATAGKSIHCKACRICLGPRK